MLDSIYHMSNDTKLILKSHFCKQNCYGHHFIVLGQIFLLVDLHTLLL